MNDQEIGARFRAISDQPRVDPPARLRQFVRNREFAAVAVQRRRSLVPAWSGPVGRGVAAIAAIGTAILIVAIAGSAWLYSRPAPIGSPEPSPTASASLRPSPTAAVSTLAVATPTPAPTPGWKSLYWDVSGEQPPLPWFGIPVSGGGYVGGCDDGQQSDAGWPYPGYPYCTSQDGLHWTTPDDAVFSGMYLSGIVAGPDDYVMVGGKKSNGEAVVFRSSDGHAWTQVPETDVEQQTLSITIGKTATHGWTPMGSVTYGSHGYVAVGWHEEWAGVPSAVPNALWHSTDGIHWAPESAPGGTYSRVFYFDGRYFLSCVRDQQFDVWYSDDALSWTRATSDSTEPGVFFRTMAKAGSTLIGNGASSSEDGLTFTSNDGGVTWREESVDSTLGVSVMVDHDSYSTDGGVTWQTVEQSGPPPGGLRTQIGDHEFGYVEDLHWGLAWFW